MELLSLNNIFKGLNDFKFYELYPYLVKIYLYLMAQIIYMICICCFTLIICFIFLKLFVYLFPSGEQGKLTISFFHPYCNAGGGGERVLWTSVRAIQERYPLAECYIYTGDCEATSEQILSNMKCKFNVTLEKPPHFIYLKFRKVIEAKYYPYFTLLGQSLGSVILAIEALTTFRPQIYVDTMGYAFTYPIFRFIGGCKIACYTHYPTISVDMLQRVSNRAEAHNNRNIIAHSPILSCLKLAYYYIFALLYGLVGKCSQVVMVNSSWTKGHIESLWNCKDRLYTIFPPCDTAKFTGLSQMPDSEKKIKTIVSIGQFRPEKDYPLQLKAFKCLLQRLDASSQELVKLVLIGGVRNMEDKKRVESLKCLAEDIGIAEKVCWKINATYAELTEEVQKGTIGLHTMWNEHFGIGIVECMAGGLIMVAHNSGGPKFDIIQPFEGQRTGFLASDEESFADHMHTILTLSSEEKSTIREAAKRSVTRFSDNVFIEHFLSAMQSILYYKTY